MKKKNILLLIVNFAVLSCIHGQRNDLTEEEYGAIKFNGFDISSIRSTKGIENVIKQYFNYDFEVKQYFTFLLH